MRQSFLPKLLLSPSVFLVLVCVYGYIAFTFYLSFTTSSILPSLEYKGTDNYVRLFGLENWSISTHNLWIFSSLYILFCTLLGLFLAILIDQKIRAEGALRSVFLYPMALSFIVTGTAWKWLLDPSIGIEHTMQQWGFSDFHFAWIKDNNLAIYCVVIAAVWQTSGFVMAMFLAGLRGVDGEVINASRVDGAKTWQTYLYIIVPQLGTVFLSAFVVLAHLAIKSYDLVIALTSGGPGRSTWLPSVFMYQYTFTRNEMAVGAASATLMLVGIGIVVFPYLVREYRLGTKQNG